MTTEKKIKAAGYVRVSSSIQIEGESLHSQRELIGNYCKSNSYKLTNIYADEGISGGTVKDRPGLLQCLYDAQQGKFNILVIRDYSRFGRDATELLINCEELISEGVQLYFIKEGAVDDTPHGKMTRTMFAAYAEFERAIIRERMLENKIARTKKGIPSIGALPIGRTFDRETKQWVLNERIAGLLQKAATDYLNGRSLLDISEELQHKYSYKIGYVNLLRVLRNRCGDKWTITFKNEKPIEFQIPRILDDETIKRICDRMDHNRSDNRTDIDKYVLTGFIKCEKCGRALTGQTQKNSYHYYRHPGGRNQKCKVFNSIPLDQIENAVFQTIFENIWDVPSFNKAITDSLPDEQHIENLKSKIETFDKELRKINKELEKLVDLAMSGTLKKDTIRAKEQELLQSKEKVSEELEDLKNQLRAMPDIEAVKQEAEDIRRQLLDQYSGQERLQEMTFEEKKRLLHWLFDGKDKEGTPYGIYVSKKDTGAIDYFLYGRITGLRTVKGDNIDYHDDNGNSGSDQQTQGNKDYKTTILRSIRVYDLRRASTYFPGLTGKCI
ncbi:MAG: recombinase family protein [Balneolales bacterium]